MYLTLSGIGASAEAGSDFDPALLAFVKCHVTSPEKWDTLRFMAEHEGRWLGAEDIARSVHKPLPQVERALGELGREEVVEELRSGDPSDTSYRLRPEEPTTIVLRRLIRTAMTSQELRSIIVAHLSRHQNGRRKAA